MCFIRMKFGIKLDSILEEYFKKVWNQSNKPFKNGGLNKPKFIEILKKCSVTVMKKLKPYCI